MRIVSLDVQIVLFEGWKFDFMKRRMISGTSVLTRGRFDVLFGGHTFMLDRENERQTGSAWRAVINLWQLGLLK